MTLSALCGKVTSMRFRRRSPEAKEARRIWEQINELPEEAGLPEQWCYCPHCGMWAWRWPPHGLGEPCPVPIGAAESFALKTDAERMAALRAGVQMEQVSQAFSKFFESQEEDAE